LTQPAAYCPLFDYGCGRGEDFERLTAEGFSCNGWDPAYRPDAPRREADVGNLGYVLNVIEDPAERAATLRQAWQLCRRLLVASAQVLMAGRGKAPVAFGDGVLTGRGTFQKFYEQDELKAYLEMQLDAEEPAVPGSSTCSRTKPPGNSSSPTVSAACPCPRASASPNRSSTGTATCSNRCWPP
jgi:DNA phosphorothioation-associated putative methyltransferase